MSRKSSARRLKRNLDLLPRWIWYLASLLVGGPIGPIVVYTVFYVLTRMEQETEDNEETESTGETDYTYTRQDDRSTVYGDGYTVMNEQEGFAEDAGEWKCTECGHKNSISASNIYESHEDYRNSNR